MPERLTLTTSPCPTEVHRPRFITSGYVLFLMVSVANLFDIVLSAGLLSHLRSELPRPGRGHSDTLARRTGAAIPARHLSRADPYCPVALDAGYLASVDPVRALVHQGREVGRPLVGSWLLGKLGVPESFSLNPGLQFLPEQPESLGSPPGISYARFQRNF